MSSFNMQSPGQNIFGPTPCLSFDELLGYYNNQVSDTERLNIERHLIDCQLCSEALEGLEMTDNQKNVRQQIESINKKIISHDSHPGQHTIQWKYAYSIAAVFILALFSALYMLLKKPSADALYAEYFSPYPNMVPLVRGESSPGQLELAMVEYESKNYRETIRILQNLLETDPQNDFARFYAGISFLCLNEPQVAIIHLHKVADKSDGEITNQAKWFIALAYLKDHNIQVAESYLKLLTAKEGTYSTKSAELLNRLE